MAMAKNLLVKFLFVSLLLSVNHAHAREEAGVEFPEQITLNNGEELVLNGAGIRKKWIIKVYVAGLYLPQTSQILDDILSMDGPKRIRMHFLYRKVSREKLLDTLDQGFRENHTPEQLNAIADEILLLKSMFKTVRKGDEVVLDYAPVTGTQVFFNQELQGTIPGVEFHRAVLRVWLGGKPADGDLKRDLLGLTD